MIEKATLAPTYFMDFETPLIQAFIAQNSTVNKSNEERAIALYYAVRDL